MSSSAGFHGRNLQDPGLLCQKAYIDGKWVDAQSRKTIPVTNPASGKVLGI